MGKLKEKILLLYHPTNDALHRWFVDGEEKAVTAERKQREDFAQYYVG